MSEVVTGEYCTCPCHDSDHKVMHCFPCCTPCPFCYRNIKMDLKQHQEGCPLNPRNQESPRRDLSHRQAVILLQESGFSDLVSGATQLADQVALRGSEATGVFPPRVHGTLTLFFVSLAEVLEDVRKTHG